MTCAQTSQNNMLITKHETLFKPMRAGEVHLKASTVKMAVHLILSVIKWLVIIGFLGVAIQYWLLNKSYLFSADGIASIAEKYAGMSCKVS